MYSLVTTVAVDAGDFIGYNINHNNHNASLNSRTIYYTVIIINRRPTQSVSYPISSIWHCTASAFLGSL